MTANKPPVLAAIELLEHINKFGRINKGISRDRVKEITKRSKAVHADLQKWVDDVPDGKDSTTGHLGHIHNLAKHLLKGVSDEK